MVPVTLRGSKEPLSMQTLTSRGSAEVDSTCSRSPARTGVLLAKSKMIPHTIIEFWDEQQRGARVIATGQRSNYKTS